MLQFLFHFINYITLKITIPLSLFHINCKIWNICDFFQLFSSIVSIKIRLFLLHLINYITLKKLLYNCHYAIFPEKHYANAITNIKFHSPVTYLRSTNIHSQNTKYQLHFYKKISIVSDNISAVNSSVKTVSLYCYSLH